MHEASMHEENSFLTLTYNKENLPSDRSVEKKEISKFIRRLRKKLEPKKIRYYSCGEYGYNLGRPHYHMCLFGHDFPDKEIRKAGHRTQFRGKFKTGHDHDLYISEYLEKVWKKGFCTIGDLTIQSAGYVARYVTKKVVQTNADKIRCGKDKVKIYYKGRNIEFALMSRNPGIGTDWIKKYKTDVYPKDFHTIKGIKCRPTRFYDSVLKRIDTKTYNKIKERRIEKAAKAPYESHMRKYQQELHRKSITKTLEREMENGTAGNICNI